MLCLCAVYFIPFYYLIVNTFKPSREATFSPLSLPGASFTLDNYRKAFDTINFLSSLRNSVVITVISVAIIILFGSMAAYTITRRKNKVTKVLFIYFLVGFMVPVQTTMIPLFKLMSSLNLTNSVGGDDRLVFQLVQFRHVHVSGLPGDGAQGSGGCGVYRRLRAVPRILADRVSTD